MNKSKPGLVKRAEILKILSKKILHMGSFLGIIRIGLYIPIGNLDLDLVNKNQIGNPLSKILKNVTGSSSFSFGYLGSIPYLYSKICIQVATPFFPFLKRLQKEGGFGRRKITRYTRDVTVGFAIWKSAFFTLENL